jgi:hypothetical protein
MEYLWSQKNTDGTPHMNKKCRSNREGFCMLFYHTKVNNTEICRYFSSENWR